MIRQCIKLFSFNHLKNMLTLTISIKSIVHEIINTSTSLKAIKLVWAGKDWQDGLSYVSKELTLSRLFNTPVIACLNLSITSSSTYYQGNISSRFCSSFESSASELLQNPE